MLAFAKPFLDSAPGAAKPGTRYVSVYVDNSYSMDREGENGNLLNRANFNTPNLITFTPTGISGTAGAITGTSTISRQVQFGLKLLW